MSSSPGVITDLSLLQLRRWLWRGTLAAALADSILVSGWIAVAGRTLLVHLLFAAGPSLSGLVGILTGVWVASGLGLPLLMFHHLLAAGTRSVWLGLGSVLALLAGMLALLLISG